jgi:hypothetical protein
LTSCGGGVVDRASEVGPLGQAGALGADPSLGLGLGAASGPGVAAVVAGADGPGAGVPPLEQAATTAASSSADSAAAAPRGVRRAGARRWGVATARSPAWTDGMAASN